MLYNGTESNQFVIFEIENVAKFNYSDVIQF